MTIDPIEASATLADIDNVVTRVKQSRIYRRAGDLFVLWGLLQFVREALFIVAPAFARNGWFFVDLVGVALTAYLLRGDLRFGGRFPWRLLAGFALIYAFGFVWSNVIGELNGRQLSAFWPSLFQFAYAFAGLWFGFAFLVIGLAAAALMVLNYLFVSDPAYYYLITAVNGGALVAAGLWMRRA